MSEIKENVVLTIVPNKKFKNTIVSIRFLNKLEKIHATERALLSMIMMDRCEKYPTKQQMSNELDYLYGAVISGKPLGYGQSQVIEIKCNVLNEQYVSEQLTKSQFEFLHEIIYRPLLTEEVLAEAKKNLFEALSRVEDTPSQYSIQEAFRIAGEGHPLGISSTGNIQEIEDVSLAGMKEAHRRLLEEDNITITVIGDIDEAEIKEYVEEFFPFKSRSLKVQTHYSFVPNELKERTMSKSVDQTNLTMIYNTQTQITDSEFWALRVGNALFGQLPISYLFQEVREKRSLAYSIYSQSVAFDSILYVNTGIQEKALDQVLDLIEEQRKRIATGDFSDDLLATAKKMLISAIHSNMDSSNALVNLIYQNTLLNETDTVVDIEHKIQAVEKEKIQEVFSRFILNTVFTIKKEDVNGKNS